VARPLPRRAGLADRRRPRPPAGPLGGPASCRPPATATASARGIAFNAQRDGDLRRDRTAAAAEAAGDAVLVGLPACPSARRRPPGPARDVIAGDGDGDIYALADDAQAGDQLGDDRRGDGTPRAGSKIAEDHSVESYALMGEGRACRRQDPLTRNDVSHRSLARPPGNRSPVLS
jgi:hypothetical protein